MHFRSHRKQEIIFPGSWNVARDSKPTHSLHYTEPALKAFQGEIRSCSQSLCWFSILHSCPRDVKGGAGRTHRTACAHMTAGGWPGTCYRSGAAGHN